MRLGFYLGSSVRWREADRTPDLEPALLAALAEAAGAGAILCGWLPAGGSAQERDLRLIRDMVRGDLMAVVPLGAEYVDAVVKSRVNGAVIVAAGWDGNRHPQPVPVEGEAAELAAVATAYHSSGLAISALVAPDATAMKSLARCGLNGAVLDASTCGDSHSIQDAQAALDQLADAALAAAKFGMSPAIGRGLNYRNIATLSGIKHIDEAYVGSAIMGRAMMVGIDRAVAEMNSLLQHSRTT